MQIKVAEKAAKVEECKEAKKSRISDFSERQLMLEAIWLC